MKTLQLSEEQARKIYKSSSEEIKIILEETFGKKFFLQKVIDRIKSIEDVFKVYEPTEDEALILNYKGFDQRVLASQAFMKISITINIFNEGWTPDWTNSNESKYAPYFNLSSGSGAVYRIYDDWNSSSAVGSLLVLKSRELAEYVAKILQKEYETFMIIK